MYNATSNNARGSASALQEALAPQLAAAVSRSLRRRRRHRSACAPPPAFVHSRVAGSGFVHRPGLHCRTCGRVLVGRSRGVEHRSLCRCSLFSLYLFLSDTRAPVARHLCFVTARLITTTRTNQMADKDIKRADPAEIWRQLALNFVEEFESLFHIGMTGSLRCTNADIDRFNDFFTRYAFPLTAETGMALDAVALEKPRQGDIGTTNDNKRLLLRFYGPCYLLYVKYNAGLRRRQDPRYQAAMEIEEEHFDTPKKPQPPPGAGGAGAGGPGGAGEAGALAF